jgi:hypothetical protein
MPPTFHLLFSYIYSSLAYETPVTILSRVLPSLCFDLVECPLGPRIGCGTRCTSPRTLQSSRQFRRQCAVVPSRSDFAMDFGFCLIVKVTGRAIMYMNCLHFRWENLKRRAFFSLHVPPQPERITGIEWIDGAVLTSSATTCTTSLPLRGLF